MPVEALLPMSTQENCQDNSFTEALANLQISQSVQQSVNSSRLANPLACLNCPSWWPCIVTKVRDAHAVVQLRPVLPPTDESAPHPPKEFTDLAANLSALTEICERKALRPATSPDAPCLGPETIFAHSIVMPQDLLPYASDVSVHQSILRHCGKPASLYVEENRVVIISPSREVIHVVGLLEDTHIRMLRQKLGIIRYIAQTKKSQEASSSDKDSANTGASSDTNAWNVGHEDGSFVEMFSVPSVLMGLAIGAHGSNIQNARSVNGVVRVDVFETKRQRYESGSTAGANADSSKQGTPYYLSVFSCPQAHFKVVAESMEAAKAARAILEYCVLCLLIPKRLVGRIIGNKSANVYSINEKAGLRHIHLESDLAEYGISVDSVSEPNYIKLEDAHPDLAVAEDANQYSAFYLLGTREAVEKARVIIGFQLECIYDLEGLEIQKRELLKDRPIGHRQDIVGPRGSAAGDEGQRGGSQVNRGRRNTNRPPRSAGDATDNHHDGSANQHEDGGAEELRKQQEESTPQPGPSTSGPRRRGGPQTQQRGGDGTQRTNGNRNRNRNGGVGGNRADGVETNGITEHHGLANGSLTTHMPVEALLPMSTQENCQDNSFTEALANLQISQSVQQSVNSSRLANPLACLNCPSWWPCIVTKVRDAHAVVQLRPVLPPTDESAPHPPKEFTDLAANLSALTEICERKALRPATSPDAPCLGPETIFAHSIVMPQDLLPYASDVSVHQSILRHCGKPASLYVEENRVVIISPSREVIHVVGLLEDTHIRMLRQKLGIIRYIAQTKKSQEASSSDKDSANTGASSDTNAWNVGHEDGSFVEMFSVPSVLMGLAIGAHGSNIQNARSVNGVVRVDVFETKRQRYESGSTAGANADSSKQGTPYYLSVFSCPQAHFKVVAESMEAAKAARAILEYCVLCLLIPKRLVGRIIGNKSANVYSINEKAGLRHIHLESDLAEYGISVDSVSEPNYIKLEDAHPDLAVAEDANQYSAFYLLGTREAVEKARVIIGFQLECIYDLEGLEIQKRELLKDRPIGHRQDIVGPRGSAAGDEGQRGGSQVNRGRRNTNRPPRSAGDATDNHHDGSANQHEDGGAEELRKQQEESTPQPGPSTSGPRRRGGPQTQQRGGDGTQRTNGNRNRNRNGGVGGNRADGVETNGITEHHGLANGVEVNGKSNHIENGGTSRRPTKRQAHAANRAAAPTAEVAASS
nr:hypothetical transcript [Hymenolepis microstoma]